MIQDSLKTTKRDDSIDFMRGAVILLMVLDHTRNMYFGGKPSPTDLEATWAALFFVRWVTHFCAPVFVFLAGYAAWLYRDKYGPGAARSFLVKRGIWLILLELTIIRFAWIPEPFYHFSILQVIWVIGLAFLFLSLFVQQNLKICFAVSGAIILLHNTLDVFSASDFGPLSWFWKILHEQGPIALSGERTLFLVYPALPWIGVCLLGYAVAGFLQPLGPDERKRWLRLAGWIGIATFVVIRAVNGYGNPLPWQAQDSALFTLMSFLNCEKYPPSLAYLLMTLGPALLLWSFIIGQDRLAGIRQVVSFGRVPLFAYVLHLYLLRLTSLAIAYAENGNVLQNATTLDDLSPQFGLGETCLVWLVACVVLYPAVKWFAAVKRRRSDGWLSYL